MKKKLTFNEVCRYAWPIIMGVCTIIGGLAEKKYNDRNAELNEKLDELNAKLDKVLK